MAASPGLILPEAVAPADRLDTLPPWPWDILDDEAPRTLGWHAIAWAEGWSGFPDMLEGWQGLTQPNGPRARMPFRFTQRQLTFLLWFYALDDHAQWIYNSAERRQPKGAGKSPFAGVHALIEFLAPVRLATFRRGAPGGCEGRQVDMPLVQITATSETQTQNTMRYVRAFAPKRSHVTEFYELDPGKTVYYAPPERTLEVTTSSVTAAEGAEATFIVKDELEHWTPTNQGDQLSSTLDDNVAKSGARSLGTCNAWVPGRDSVAEHDWNAWILEQEGRVQGDTRQLYDAILPFPDVEMADPDSLRTNLERLYGDCDWKKPHEPDPENHRHLRPVPGSKPDVTSIMRRIYDPKSKPDDSERKYLNRPTAAEDAWVLKEQWQMLATLERPVEKGERIAMFFDGSRSRDATALVGCTIDDGHVFTIGTWEPDPKHTTESVVNVIDVDRVVRWARRQYTVLGFFADVEHWESFTKVEWPDVFADGDLIVDAAGGKDPHKIAWDMRTRTYPFTLACELTQAEIEDGGFTQDGNEVLGRHVANARRRPNKWGISIGKETKDSAHKVDAAVCMIGARMVRRLVLAELAKLPEERDRTVGRM